MAKPTNVKIPLALLNRILYLLDCWNLVGYDEVVQADYSAVKLKTVSKLNPAWYTL